MGADGGAPRPEGIAEVTQVALDPHLFLAQGCPGFVFGLDDDGAFAWVAPDVTGVLGWSPPELVGMAVAELVHPQDRAGADGQWARMRKGQVLTHSSGGLVLRLRDNTGTYRWMDWGQARASDIARALKTDRHSPVLVACLRDVDGLVRANVQVNARRERLESALDALLEPHVVLEAVRNSSGVIADFVYVEANAAACEYNGMDHRDLVGARLLDLFPGYVDSGLLEQYRQVVETGEPLVLDDRPHTMDPLDRGKHFVEIRATRVGDGMSYTWRDVTDRHRAVEALAAAEARYRLLAENSTDVVWQFTPDGVINWTSPSIQSVLGWAPDQLIGRPGIELVHPDDKTEVDPWRIGIPSGGPVEPIEVRIGTADGGYRWMSCQARISTNPDGSVSALVVGMRDAQKQVEARKALERSEARFQMLAENASDVVWHLDSDTVLRWVTPSIEAVLGWAPEQLLGTSAIGLVHPGDLPALSQWRESVLAGVAVAPLELRLRKADGDFRWMSLHTRPTVKSDGVVDGAVVGLRDVQEQVIARENLARSEAMFRLAMAGAPQGMAVVGLHGRFLRVNDVLCDLVGRDISWMHEHDEYDVIHPDDLATDLAARDRLLAGDAELDIHEGRLVSASGDLVWMQHSLALVRDEHNMPLFYVSQFQDITGARAAQQDLQYRAEHDVLTGLINREQLQERLVEVLARQPRAAGVPAVLFCDLDYFKNVNDANGHAGGDHVLRVVAERVEAVLRDGDQVARLGGDEFVVVLPEVTDIPAAIGVAEKIRAAVAQPLPLGTHQVTITTSVGIALATPGIEASRLLRDADSALYEAKNAGRDQIAVFDPDPGAEIVGN